MKIMLTPEQITCLKEQHKRERDRRVADRIKAVLMFHSGWKIKDISQALLVGIDTISSHIEDYLTKDKLQPANGGSKPKLNPDQTQELITHLEKHTYTKTTDIVSYVNTRYQISYTATGIYSWLRSNNFTYKKVAGTPEKADIAKQEVFKETYFKLKEGLSEKGILLFMDSCYPTQATKLSYGWIRKGKEQQLDTFAGRKRINITGAINLANEDLFVKECDTVNGEMTVEFLRELEEKNSTASKIHVIADGASSHKSQEVQLYLNEKKAVNRNYLLKHHDIDLPSNSVVLSEKIKKDLQNALNTHSELFINKEILETKQLTTLLLLESFAAIPEKEPPRIVIHILPPYSPNLNPIERVWKVMNEYVRNNKTFASFKEFREKIMHFFQHTWSEIKPKMETRITDNFQELKMVSRFAGSILT